MQIRFHNDSEQRLVNPPPPLDQLLLEGLSGDPDSVGDVGEFELGKKVERGRLV